MVFLMSRGGVVLLRSGSGVLSGDDVAYEGERRISVRKESEGGEANSPPVAPPVVDCPARPPFPPKLAALRLSNPFLWLVTASPPLVIPEAPV